MSKLNDQRVALTKRIMATDDVRKLDAVVRFLDGTGHIEFTDAEIAEFESIRTKHLSGDGHSTSWSELKRELRKELRS